MGRGRWSRHFHIIALASLTTLMVWCGPVDARPLTLEEQAHINVLKEFLPPDYVDGMIRELDEIDAREDLDADEKKAEAKKLLDKETRKASKRLTEAMDDKSGLLDPVRASKVYQIIQGFRALYANTDTVAPRAPEVTAEIERLRAEERKKQAESQGTGGTSRSNIGFSLEGSFVAGHLDTPTQKQLAAEPVL